MPGYQLETQEGHGGYGGGNEHCFQICLPDPLEFPGAVVKADNGLQSLGQADDQGKEYHVYLGYDACAGQRNFAAVMGLGAIIAEDIVHYNLYHHHGHLVKEGGHAQGGNGLYMGWDGGKGAEGQADGLKPCQVQDDHDAGYDLSDDGSQCSARHSHAEAEDEQGVQYGVEDGAGQGAHHGESGAAVRTYQVGTACGQDEKWKAKGCDACIGQ